MRRRTFLATAATLALPSVTQAASKQVLKFVPQADLAVLDPILTTAGVTRSHGYLLFDNLYGVTGPEEGFKATPQMAAGHRLEDDGLTWRVTLRDGLVFHDGQRVLARDCVASIRRWGVGDTFGQALMARTDKLSAADDTTITFRLKRPFPLLPDALGKMAASMCAIMPERLASTDPFKQITEMIGSGPYRFKADERVQGSRFVYERFAGYQPREDGEPNWTSGPKVAISTVSNGRSSQTRRLHPRHSRRARWIGGSCRPATSWRCYGVAARSGWSSRNPRGTTACSGRTTSILPSITRRCAVHCWARLTRPNS